MNGVSMATAGRKQTWRLQGVIGWDVVATEFAAALDALNPADCDELELEIFSPGGSVWDGNYICAKLRELAIPTTASIYVAASMATLIAAACKRTRMAANGRWLIHNPWSSVTGDAAELEKRAAELRATELEAAGVYAAKTGKTRDDMLALMKQERWIRAKEAKAIGFVDEVFAAWDAKALAGMVAEWKEAGVLGQAAAELETLTAEEAPADVPAAVPPLTDGTDALDGAPAKPPAEPVSDLAAEREATAAIIAGLRAKLGNAEQRYSELGDQNASLAQQLAEKAAELNAAAQAHKEDQRQLEEMAKAAEAVRAHQEKIIGDLRRRLQVFTPALAGTDQDAANAPGSGDYWQRVSELENAGLSREAAITEATIRYPAAHAAMLAAANPTQR